MIQERDAQQLAIDAVSYVGNLKAILARCTSEGRYGYDDDYAVHKHGAPLGGQNSGNWISTPSVPLYIQGIFKEVSELEIEDKLRPNVAALLESTVEDLERISQSKNPAPGYVKSAGNIIEFTGSALPEIKKILKGIKSPEVV
jgi:hypothetical protein